MKTYTMCKTLIENYIKKGTMEIQKEDMLTKLDIFLLGDRITQEQYEELVKMMQ